MAMDVYTRLMAGAGSGNSFDRHLFACAIAVAMADRSGRPLTSGLGLSAFNLAALVGRYFPLAPGLLSGLSGEEEDEPLAAEEPDLRALLVEHRSRGLVEEEWLAHVIARRSLGANHLWQDLGLTGRADLSGLMRRHFSRLAEANSGDMKWKKFFYRELCQREGIVICKSPNCEVCADVAVCFGAEDGVSLLAHRPVSQIRHCSVSP
ncbi:hydrogenase [Paramagnetospirillum kuznetsovii]|uniref:Hydrogenase n=1 Tax=Paramagnetospirillum kuznetsovii TaxID=2053833 RepID=A0A364NZD8_9PROT|nr:nitrogen fixation protein NifQ [Paramagnetospirillum kuznetsovii]RAU22360.1 hydrogenase [Paramagnetospirillum kuznetsovii]